MWSWGSVFEGANEGSGFTLSAFLVRRKDDSCLLQAWQTKAVPSLGISEGLNGRAKKGAAIVWIFKAHAFPARSLRWKSSLTTLAAGINPTGAKSQFSQHQTNSPISARKKRAQDKSGPPSNSSGMPKNGIPPCPFIKTVQLACQITHHRAPAKIRRLCCTYREAPRSHRVSRVEPMRSARHACASKPANFPRPLPVNLIPAIANSPKVPDLLFGMPNRQVVQ